MEFFSFTNFAFLSKLRLWRSSNGQKRNLSFHLHCRSLKTLFFVFGTVLYIFLFYIFYLSLSLEANQFWLFDSAFSVMSDWSEFLQAKYFWAFVSSWPSSIALEVLQVRHQISCPLADKKQSFFKSFYVCDDLFFFVFHWHGKQKVPSHVRKLFARWGPP